MRLIKIEDKSRMERSQVDKNESDQSGERRLDRSGEKIVLHIDNIMAKIS